MNRCRPALVPVLGWTLLLSADPTVRVRADGLPPASPRQVVIQNLAEYMPSDGARHSYHDRCWVPAPPGLGTPERDSCYPPSQLSRAKRRAPLMVDPSKTVTSLTGLRLTDIVISYWGRRFVFIDLLYGDLVCMKPCPGELASHPRLIDVMQAAGKRYSARSNSFSLTQFRYETGLWFANGYLSERDLSFTVAGVARKQTIRKIASAVIALGKRRTTVPRKVMEIHKTGRADPPKA